MFLKEGYKVRFKVLDLFSGAGGLSYGLDSQGDFETVVATDFFRSALDTLQANSPNVDIVFGDITDGKVKDEIVERAKARGVNMVVGGPPCQGFSNKGKKLGLSDPRNFLFLEFVDVVSRLEPEVFIIENVKTLTTAVNGYFIQQIEEEFRDLGYMVSHRVLKASDFGVPQTRERTIIIGSRTVSFNFDLMSKATQQLTVRDAISDLDYLESGQGVLVGDYANQPRSDYQKSLRKDSDKLHNHVATAHSKGALHKLSLIPAEKGKEYLPKELLGNQKFKTTWSRLEWDKPSPTIDTRFDTPSNGKNSHPYLHRAITPREAARIQSFPDSFVFVGSKTEICRQIGNAVPPLLARAIGAALSQQYASRDETVVVGGDNRYTLYNGDAYNKINELIKANVQVDHIITDPPYNISADNNFGTMKTPRKGVDFGSWDWQFDLTRWIGLYQSLIKKDGSIIIFCSYRFMSDVIRALESEGFDVKDVLIWRKSNPMPRNINRRYVQDMEFAVWAVKSGAKWVFNKPASAKYLRSMYEAPVVAGKERTNHPTQKSLKVMQDIINIHTNPDDVILDPFMGSGTTGVAAVASGRKFIGIELEAEYFELSSNRLAATATDTDEFVSRVLNKIQNDESGALAGVLKAMGKNGLLVAKDEIE